MEVLRVSVSFLAAGIQGVTTRQKMQGPKGFAKQGWSGSMPTCEIMDLQRCISLQFEAQLGNIKMPTVDHFMINLNNYILMS